MYFIENNSEIVQLLWIELYKLLYFYKYLETGFPIEFLYYRDFLSERIRALCCTITIICNMGQLCTAL